MSLLFQEEEEENFMVAAVCTAAEEGNIDTIQSLLDEAANFDISTTNKVREKLLSYHNFRGQSLKVKHILFHHLV